MNEKEVAEIRRRFKPEKSNITHIHGCYVNEKREIVSEFNQSLAMMPQEESEKFLSILKRALSGTLGKNLVGITFATKQVVDSEEHRLLMALRDSGLRDDGAVRSFYQKAIASLTLEGNYLILLAHDAYDVPYRSKDGEGRDASETFSYLLCAVCPVKLTKPALGYDAYKNEFHNLVADDVVSPPDLGFLFPAFDDRGTNLYGALYYSRDIAESHTGFVDAVFHCDIPMPAAAQKEAFQSVLGEALDEECSLKLVQAVHGQITELIEEHRENKESAPLSLSKGAVSCMLKSCGVSERRVTAFEEEYDEAFGPEIGLGARNIVDSKKLEVRTPDVTIQVSAERSDLVEARVIDGVKYILIRADEGVEVNGVAVKIT